MTDILNIRGTPIRDEIIIRKQYYSYSPFTTSFENNDEVRIGIQSQDLYVLPSESYILMEFEVSRKPGAEHTAAVGVWTSNYATFLFSEIRYELNGVEIDRTKNVGITSNVKMFAAITCPRKTTMMNINNASALIMKTYSIVLPLNQVLGFCDDYRKIILNIPTNVRLIHSI